MQDVMMRLLTQLFPLQQFPSFIWTRMTMTTTPHNERTPEELSPASTDSETKDTHAARLLSHAARKAQHAALSGIRHPAVVTAAVKRHDRLCKAMDVLLHRNNAENVTFYGPQRERSV